MSRRHRLESHGGTATVRHRQPPWPHSSILIDFIFTAEMTRLAELAAAKRLATRNRMRGGCYIASAVPAGPAWPAAASCWRPTASSSGTTTWCGPRASGRARWRWCAGCCSSPYSPSYSGWRGGPATAAPSLQSKLSSLQITVSSVQCCSGNTSPTWHICSG